MSPRQAPSSPPSISCRNESVVFVTELRPYDVLHGRGAAHDRMVGNVRFRAMIKEKSMVYPVADASGKKHLAEGIVESVLKSNGRFLRAIDSEAEARSLGIAPGVLAWMPVEGFVALEKVKQALRDAKRLESSTSYSSTNEVNCHPNQMLASFVDTSRTDCLPAASLVQEALMANRFDQNHLQSFGSNSSSMATKQGLSPLEEYELNLLDQQERLLQLQRLRQQQNRAQLLQQYAAAKANKGRPISPLGGGGAVAPTVGKSFTGKSLLVMLQAQVLAESASDLPFLQKIWSTYKTVIESPASHQLTPTEKVNLYDAVRSVEVAIAEAAAATAASTKATVVSPCPFSSSATAATASSLSSTSSRGSLTKSSLSTGMGRRNASFLLTSSPSSSGRNPTLTNRAALIADCAPSRRKRGYLEESTSLQQLRIIQSNKKAKQLVR